MMYNVNEITRRVILEVKRRLTEGLSQRLFHFCPVNAMFAIAKTDSFKLTSVESRPSDAKMTSLPINGTERKQYQYYMCFSRTPSSLAGYVNMRRDKTGGPTWNQSLVRMEIDGDLLNANYKGMPVNYFNDKTLPKINHYTKGKNGERETVTGANGIKYSMDMDVKALDNKGRIRNKVLHRYTPHKDDDFTPKRGRKSSKVTVDYGVIDRNQMSEYEDRLFSNKPYIKDIKERGLIKRIDIYLCPAILNNELKYSQDILYMVDEIIDVFGDIVHIFNNFSSFEGVNIVNSIDGYDFKKQYLEVPIKDYTTTHERTNNTDELGLLRSELWTIVRYATILGFDGFGKDWEKITYDNTAKILNKIDIDPSDKEVSSFINTFIGRIGSDGETFFTYQSKALTKELELIPPYKLEKYVGPLDKIEKMQRRIYALQTGEPLSILGVKRNKCKQ